MKSVKFFLCSILLLISFTACQNTLSSDLENDVHLVPIKMPPPPDVIKPADEPGTNLNNDEIIIIVLADPLPTHGRPPNR